MALQQLLVALRLEVGDRERAALSALDHAEARGPRAQGDEEEAQP